MNPKSPTQFQNGVIDIFKINKVFDLNIVNIIKKGDVTVTMDKEIGRKVIKILGNLSPSNTLAIPNTNYTKSLNYVGKYYYIFFKAFNDHKFSFQFTFVYNQTDIVRFIFKFPLKQLKISRTNSYNIEIPIQIDENRNNLWSLYKFDPVEFISTNLVQYKDFSALTGLSTEGTVLRNFEAFSTLVVRGVYISNTSFTVQNLPKEMSYKGSDTQMLYYFDVCSGEIRDVEQLENEDIERVELADTTVKKYETEDFSGSMGEINKRSQELKKENIQRKKQNIVDETMKKLAKTEAKPIDKSKISQEIQSNYDLKETNHELLRKNMDSLNQEFIETRKEGMRNLFKKETTKKVELLPDPIMHLNYLLGFTAQNCPKIQFNSNGEYETQTNIFKENKVNLIKKNIYFTSGSTLVKFSPFDIKQSFFFGHSKPINNFLLACNGEVAFTCQEGKNSIIRVWKTDNSRCIKMLTTPYDKIKVMTESKDSKYLCTVGNEQNKESVILWDISNLDEINVFIKQSSPTQITTMKFSPFEPNILVSCGRENIKFWRIKNDHLSGKAVVLNQYARNTIFLCMDFNNTLFGDEYCADKGKLFVGSSNGCVFQITCNNQEMEAVYKVQDSSILSISVNEAFCVTGSFDGYLRVWPVDFTEFLIEAKHDSGICSVDISYDAMDILCGTLNGNIGMLNVQNKEYKTILRSPPTLIQKMIAHPSGNYIFTIENDMSVRVWDVEHKSEAFQFLSTKDPPNALAAPKLLVFACGFMSGLLKIFDLEKTEILYESKPFQSHITHIKYIQNDSFLISMSSQGNMSIHDTSNNYIQVKLLKIDQAANFTDLSLSIDEDYFASIGPESNCVIVWNALTFGIKNRVPVSNFFVTKICLINKNMLAVILENCTVKFYSLCNYEGIFMKELINIHINQTNQFFVTKNCKYLISGGDEGMIKIWDLKMAFKNINCFQQFIGHSNAVRSILIIENKSLLISASENSGIYFWNFLGDLTFTETEITQELEKLGDVNQMKEFLSTAKNHTQTGFGMTKKTKQSLNTTSNIRIKHMEKAYLAENNPNYEILKKTKSDIEKNELNSGKVLTMLPIQEDKDGIDINYSNTDFNVTQEDLERFTYNNQNSEKLLSKLIFGSKFLPEKIEHFVQPQIISTKLKMQFCLGLSLNTTHNLLFNQIDKWYAFTVNNKVIVEFLENERTEIVLEDSKDELSCLSSSSDGKYLIAGVGCAYREEYAAIMVYETSQWTLKKKLNFHFKGVQCLSVSPNNKYMISIGSKEEKSICIWNFSNLTVIDSKSVKFVPLDLKCEHQMDMFLYFTTISQNVISFWRMDNNFKLEGFHVNLDDLTREREKGEYMISLEMTPYYQQIKTSFVIIGTNKGNILIIDKEKKVLIRKYMVSKFPITHLFYSNNIFVCAGEGPIIYQWSFDPSDITSKNVLQFLEKEKSNLILLDSSVASMQLFNGKDGLCSTDTGSIFFINFEEKAAFKIISSHINCGITSIECDINNENVLTCGGDGTVRCWTMDSFDQKFQLLKLEQKPEKCLLNSKDNILIIHYDLSYLRLYNLTTLKSLGMLRIPDNDICNFEMLFNNQAILLTTYQEKIYIIEIQNWEPLSVLFSELPFGPNVIPVNQYCKSLSCKNITSEKAYASLSFSDGTVSTLCIEKLNGKIETSIIDKFNMIEYHMSKGEDRQIKEMYLNISNYRSDYKSQAKFSYLFDDVLLCFHECLQFLYVRNYTTNEVIKSIPLNYFPYSFDLSEDDKYMAIGTKEGLVLYITRTENHYNSGFNLDIFNGHYNHVDTVRFNKDASKLLTSSYSELFVWIID